MYSLWWFYMAHINGRFRLSEWSINDSAYLKSYWLAWLQTQLAVLTITGLAFRDLFGWDGPSDNSYTSYHHLTAVKQWNRDFRQQGNQVTKVKTVSSALCSKATVLLSRVRPSNWTYAMPLSDKCPINAQWYEEHSISNNLKVTRLWMVMALALLLLVKGA